MSSKAMEMMLSVQLMISDSAKQQHIVKRRFMSGHLLHLQKGAGSASSAYLRRLKRVMFAGLVYAHSPVFLDFGVFHFTR